MSHNSRWICDQCSKHFEGSSGYPTGWLIVKRRQPGGLEVGEADICSYKCLAKWANERKTTE